MTAAARLSGFGPSYRHAEALHLLILNQGGHIVASSKECVTRSIREALT